MEFDIYSWVVIPLLIFLARVTDVSLGTLRFIFIARGYRKLAPLLGLAEVLIWVLAVREVLMNLRNIACLLALAEKTVFSSLFRKHRKSK